MWATVVIEEIPAVVWRPHVRNVVPARTSSTFVFNDGAEMVCNTVAKWEMHGIADIALDLNHRTRCSTESESLQCRDENWRPVQHFSGLHSMAASLAFSAQPVAVEGFPAQVFCEEDIQLGLVFVRQTDRMGMCALVLA